jgi:hypothetical protein
MTQTTLFKESTTETKSTCGNLAQGYAHEPFCVGFLLRWGYQAVQVTGQTSSDIWLKHEKYICLLQVKTSGEIKNGMVKGSCCRGRYEKTKYTEDDMDILALFYTEKIWPLFFHVTDDDRKHVYADPKDFTEENAIKTFNRAFQKFKDRKCP